MKNYLLFTGECHYPNGGWWDYVDNYVSLSAACEAVNEFEAEKHYGEFWWHVVDLESADVCISGYGKGTNKD